MPLFHAIYYEEEIRNHSLTASLLKKHSNIPHIPCRRYGEIFNRKSQNFRLQKQNPSLILAKKFDRFILETPKGYSIGGENNFYFSHMLNCVFDCRYCFLQGMYRSANYVIFVNFDDFHQAILNKIQEAPSDPLYFFSGYDCDSLALEQVTHFAESFLPLFEKHNHTFLELRTKSTNIEFLLRRSSFPNCIVAYTLTPAPISKALEHKTPSFAKRLEALQELQRNGWPIGLRFDPIIYCDNFKEIYNRFFHEVFQALDITGIHSVTLGPFRMPRGVFKNIVKLYPDEKLFAHSLNDNANTVSYPNNLEKELLDHCKTEILKYLPKHLLFSYKVTT